MPPLALSVRGFSWMMMVTASAGASQWRPMASGMVLTSARFRSRVRPWASSMITSGIRAAYARRSLLFTWSEPIVTLQTSLRDTDKIAFLRGLRQIRQPSPEPVPDEALQDILEVARWTGSARNIQPWDLIVIRDRSTLQTLARLEGSHAAHLVNAGAGIALVMSGDLEHPEFDTYDEGRLRERIMLGAAANGLGSAIGWVRDR